MNTAPGEDELRIRKTLRKRIDGEGPVATASSASADEWWERLYDETKTDHAGAVPKRRRIPALKRPAVAKPEVDPEEADPEWEDAEPENESTPQAVKLNRRRQEIRAAYADLDPRIRWVLYNGAAASAGYISGITPHIGAYLASYGHAATGITALGLATAAAVAAWKLTGLRAIAGCLGLLPGPVDVIRVLAATAAAGFAAGYAPAVVVWLARYGTSWGVGPDDVSLLLTAVGVCGGLYLLIDQPISRHRWRQPFLWVSRIPLASAVLALALYAPGVSP
jgi:hypothetical protein